jgi:hypothetical protein
MNGLADMVSPELFISFESQHSLGRGKAQEQIERRAARKFLLHGRFSLMVRSASSRVSNHEAATWPN